MEFQIDWNREYRTGVSEAVICVRKSTAQIEAVIRLAHAAGRRLLFTRLGQAEYAALTKASTDLLDYEPISSTAVLGGIAQLAPAAVGIVAAGTSDLPVAYEAARTLAFAGHAAPIIADVGVAGLWRLMDRIEEIRKFRVLIAVAGMEGALFSVLAGLVSAPVIAVPTSVGYGVANGGTTALHAALASCSPGVVVVNIDNGYGAASAAIKILTAS